MRVCIDWVTKLSRTCISCGPRDILCGIRRSQLVSPHRGIRSLAWWRLSALHKRKEHTFLQLQIKRNSTILPSSEAQNLMEIQKVRKDVREIFDAALRSVYPPQMVRNAVTVSNDGNRLFVDGQEYGMYNNVYIVGFGKAVSGMARAVEELIGDHLVTGIISIPYNAQHLFRSIGKENLCLQEGSKIKVHEGAENNFPDDNAVTAALAIQELTQKLCKDDLLIVLISGGGSALLPSPIPPLTLQDELEMTRIVSRSGGSIFDLNILRQNLESLKGGGLAEQAKPASVVSLILSDVIEDKLDIISSGPTAPLLSSPRQCLKILERLKVKDMVPHIVIEMLEQKTSHRSIAERSHNIQSFESRMKHVQNVIIGSNTIATKAAEVKATEQEYVPLILTNSLQGEAKEAAVMFSELAKYAILSFGDCRPNQGKTSLCVTEVGLIRRGINKTDLKRVEAAVGKAHNSKTGVCIICGGETTVNVKGTGKGGRNQEMSLAFAMEFSKAVVDDKSGILRKFHVEFLSAGTDGQDGPTDAAGAVVNRYLIPATLSAKLNPDQYLQNNDSYTLFKSIKENKCLIQSGLTGTNVMDIQVMIVKHDSWTV